MTRFTCTSLEHFFGDVSSFVNATIALQEHNRKNASAPVCRLGNTARMLVPIRADLLKVASALSPVLLADAKTQMDSFIVGAILKLRNGRWLTAFPPLSEDAYSEAGKIGQFTGMVSTHCSAAMAKIEGGDFFGGAAYIMEQWRQLAPERGPKEEHLKFVAGLKSVYEASKEDVSFESPLLKTLHTSLHEISGHFVQAVSSLVGGVDSIMGVVSNALSTATSEIVSCLPSATENVVSCAGEGAGHAECIEK